MGLKYSIEKHAVCFPSKTLATNYAAHIYNITLTEDVDNGFFVGKGAWQELDRYEEAAPTSVNAIVRAKAANGNYYVEIIDAKNAYLVYNVPMIEEEYNNEFKKLENFVNLDGDVVRAYTLTAGDIIELSEAGFSATPVIGANVTLQAIAGKTAMQLG